VLSAHGILESEFNKALAINIKKVLEENNVRTMTIGQGGAGNAPIGNSGGASFELSIHQGAVQPQFLETWNFNGQTYLYADWIGGFSLFVSHNGPYAQASLICASAIGNAMQSVGFKINTAHAADVVGERREWADEANGVYYNDSVDLLARAQVPAVILEGGVIANRKDEATLSSDEGRTEIATAVAAGFASCGLIKQ
jgi:N-acetylmuramoyl-L-alanine amidase